MQRERERESWTDRKTVYASDANVGHSVRVRNSQRDREGDKKY